MRPRLSILVLALSLAIGGGTGRAQSSGQPDLSAIDQSWTTELTAPHPAGTGLPFAPPPEARIPDDAFGLMVRRGMDIFTNTPAEAKAYVHDGLTCANCHLDRGRRAGATPMWAAWVTYPRFRSKNDRVNTMAMRIQGCFRFSMNGTPPPDDSEIMAALQSYFFWLATGAPTGARLQGAGFPALAEPAEPPSIARGAAVFAAACAACHGAGGQGRRIPGLARYQFPPLWGANSYNWGAGMESVETAARFIHANMPWGLQDALSEQQAWDVAMFVNSHERPQDPRFTVDLAETRARFHDSKWSLYGSRQGGVMLGDPANYPLAGQ
jgi:thiosulfate dehydrogenase